MIIKKEAVSKVRDSLFFIRVGDGIKFHLFDFQRLHFAFDTPSFLLSCCLH
jgi:hypothetical protein